MPFAESFMASLAATIVAKISKVIFTQSREEVQQKSGNTDLRKIEDYLKTEIAASLDVYAHLIEMYIALSQIKCAFQSANVAFNVDSSSTNQSIISVELGKLHVRQSTKVLSKSIARTDVKKYLLSHTAQIEETISQIVAHCDLADKSRVWGRDMIAEVLKLCEILDDKLQDAIRNVKDA